MSLHTYQVLQCLVSILIQEVVKEPLKTLSDVLEILLPRLQPSQDVIGVSIEVQQSLVRPIEIGMRSQFWCLLQVSILVGELSSQFSILHHYQIDDPFLVSLHFYYYYTYFFLHRTQYRTGFCTSNYCFFYGNCIIYSSYQTNFN